MKILELDLHAFGPFSDLQLDLSQGTEGLHVIYGPNEAGKSSALRALHALFYGVPERTTDDFVHDNRALRVGGRIRDDVGDEHLIYRRKGRKKTLLDDVDGEPLDDVLMTRLIAGVDERLFNSLFGIDHSSLVEGGQSLLLEQGEEAEALFGSGLGSTTVHSLLESFDEQARDLFAPQASKPRINKLLKELKDTKNRLRDESLSARKWSEARKDVELADEDLRRIEEQITTVYARRSLLERVRRTLPNLAKRAGYLLRLSELKAIPQLPGDFSETCQEALSAFSQAQDDRLKAQEQIRIHEVELSKIQFSKDLIERADEIDENRERLGSYRKANADRPKLVTMEEDRKQKAIESLNEIRQDLNIDDISVLHDAIKMRRRLTDLGGRKDSLETSVRSAKSILDRTDKDHKKILGELADLQELPNILGLRVAVEQGQGLGEIDQDVTTDESRLNKDIQKIQALLDALGLWCGEIEDFPSAPLPSPETIQVYVEEVEDVLKERETAVKDRKQARVEMTQAEEVLRKLELMGDVPTEAELQEIRSNRDQVWQLLRKRWLEDEDVSAAAESFGGVGALPDEFEHRISKSDEISDRLRREAQHVHENSSAQAKLDTCQRIIAEIDTTLEQLAESELQSSKKWTDLWSASDIEPRSPREMKEWISEAIRIRERIDGLDDKQSQLETRINRRKEVVEELVREFRKIGTDTQAPKGDQLRPILNTALSQIESIDSSAQDRQRLIDKSEELKEKILGYEQDLTEAEEEFTSWQDDWQLNLQELGVGDKPAVSDVLDYLDACDTVNSLVKEAKDLEQRITGINADNEQFETDVGMLLSELAPDLSELATADALNRLARRLTDNREAATRYQSFKEQQDEATKTLTEAEASLVVIKASLVTLCEQAKCDKEEDLLNVSHLAKERDDLTVELKKAEAELLEGGDGLTIDELANEASKEDRDQLIPQIQNIDEQLDGELNPEQRRLIQKKVGLERTFLEMAGANDAALLAEEAQRIVSELSELSRQYVRIKIAGRILRDQIEQFRQQNRSPILSKASHYFSRLTCDAFSEISTSLDESDRPVLVAIRSNNERLQVEDMSTGTRDQLYLALRLATLEHYADGAEPLPFIVDDILIQFDDDRSASTLEGLAEFSARTQVILFTHHRQVVEQATNIAANDNGVFIHELQQV